MKTVDLDHNTATLAELVDVARTEGEVILTSLNGESVKIATVKPKPKIATPEMIARRKAAWERLRQLNPFRDIEDPVAWQREIREDRQLPGRD